jgi:hypothetical protein
VPPQKPPPDAELKRSYMAARAGGSWGSESTPPSNPFSGADTTRKGDDEKPESDEPEKQLSSSFSSKQ